MVCIAVGIIVMLPLCRMFLNKKKKGGDDTANAQGKTLDELVEEYHLSSGVRRYVITPTSTIKEKSVAELDLRNRFGLSILEVRNEKADRSGILHTVTQSIATPEMLLSAGDIIYLMGDTAKMDSFARESKVKKLDNNNIDFYELGIAEIVLMRVEAHRHIGAQLRLPRTLQHQRARHKAQQGLHHKRPARRAAPTRATCCSCRANGAT